jgi:hypothetical protein
VHKKTARKQGNLPLPDDFFFPPPRWATRTTARRRRSTDAMNRSASSEWEELRFDDSGELIGYDAFPDEVKEEDAALLGPKPPPSLPPPASAPLGDAEEYELYLNKDAGLATQRSVAQLDFTAGRWGPRLAMPDVLQALVCDHLDRTDLRNLQHASRGAHYFVQRRHRRLSRFRNPQHLGKLTTFKDLDSYQRLDLKLMRFYDRPIHHRCAIGVACVPLVPFVLLYHSPKAFVWGYHRVVAPASTWVARRLIVPAWYSLVHATKQYVVRPTVWTARTVYEEALVPIAKGAAWTSRTIYNRALVPIAQGAAWTGRTAYKGASWTACATYRNVLTPIGHGISWVARTIYEGALVPLGHGTVRVAKTIQERGGRMRRAILERVLKPTWRGLCSVARGTYDHVLTPIGHGISWTVERLGDVLEWIGRQLYLWVLTPIGRTVRWTVRLLWRIVCWTCRQLWRWLLAPFGRAVAWFWRRLLWPVLRTFWHVVRFVSQDIIWKVLVSLWELARFLVVDGLFDACLVPLSLATYTWVLVPLGELVSFTATAIWAATTTLAQAVVDLGSLIARAFGA